MARAGVPRRELVVLPLVLVAAAALWYLHAQAWDLGGRSPLLGFETGRTALAARELSQRGTLTTPFALPVELAVHPSPPWPLLTLQPGMVLAQAAVMKLVPQEWAPGSEYRAWLTLLLPFACFLMLAASLALAVRHLFARTWPEAPSWVRIGAGLTLGLSFALDPEAQQLAMGGFSELPYTLGLFFALLGLALGAPGRHPLGFGLVLGLTGLMRADMLPLAPVFALAGAMSAEPGRRVRIAALVLIGFALPNLPWWLYQWARSGDAAWRSAQMLLFDRVAGFDWFALHHRPELPALPSGLEAVRQLAAKAFAQLPSMLLALTLGPRGLWLGALVVWLVSRPPRPLAAAGLVALTATLFAAIGAALTLPWPRLMFTARVLAEPAGMLALWALLWRADDLIASRRLRIAACAAVAVLALGWGAWSTQRGWSGARAAAAQRETPGGFQLTRMTMLMTQRIDRGDPVMSNLGPALAWRSRRPVIHLADSPGSIAATRARCDFRHILLCFRTGERAWPAWQEIWSREGAAAATAGLDVVSEQRYETSDGFTVVWIELGPRGPMMAALP